MKAVGARLPRYDGIGHVTGRTQYVDDVRVGKTLWVKALRSPHHHAAITSLDASKAEAMAGVYAVITHEDVPHNVYGHLEGLGVPGDEPLLADGEVRYRGQPIAAVAAESEAAAYAAVQAAFYNHYAAQCGFCTPGMVLAATALIERSGGPVEREDVLEALGGHYCRCTGYVKIVDAVVAASGGVLDGRPA